MILPAQHIAALIQTGNVVSPAAPHSDSAVSSAILPETLQPASLDLRLGAVAHRLRASFLPGPKLDVADMLPELALHDISLEGGAVLETGCLYLVPLMESLNLPDDLSALANPKSSTGRLDVFTRVIGNGSDRFDALPPGYSGPLWLEIAPRTFPILVRPGDRLAQMRFRRGEAKVLRRETVSIDLAPREDGGPVGYRARRHSGLVDLRKLAGHDPKGYWEPLRPGPSGLVLDPDEFYILASREAVSIPVDEAAEMAPVALEIGEFRAHYAGFFDPGFGVAEAGGAGSRAVLEVRGRDVPFLLRHGQPVAHLLFEKLAERPDRLYGTGGASYQSQGLRLSKHFAS